MLEKLFHLKENKTNLRTEAISGTTTFLAMAYILVVNPAILSATGMDSDAVFVATALSAVIGTLIMAFMANLPVALAPGMGMNAFFAYGVVIVMGYTWQQALAGIFISGVLFICLSVSGVREKIIKAIPQSLRAAVAVGIGFFIAFVGLKNSGLIVASEATFVTFGNLGDPAVILTVVGLVITLVLMVKKIPAAIFIGLVGTTVIGMVAGIVPMPTAVFGAIPSLDGTFGAVFEAIPTVFTWQFIPIIFAFLFVDFFDTAGTLLAVTKRAGLVDEEGNVKNMGRAMFGDAIATTIGAVLGTSSVTSFVESLTGVEVGGRTGLSAVFTALCFLLSLFFAPLIITIAQVPAITAPALILVGALMVESLRDVDFSDEPVVIGTFFIIIFMLLTYSIAKGIAIGFIFYTIAMVAKGRYREIPVLLWVLDIIFIANFVVGVIFGISV
ncbi:NCS2 family permease [Culicoidibacter larvae]|uniref:NCS2 family permease n=1 Tax=Culicoidibacter larvae TaxID=2579976 RepID=A0A5R8QE29_9FIRM|nr:NCS2 family permease [Culicoidibacter larvae]TLG75280.1 NCS2 family permease [Culicoidibacter larvae]